MPVIDEPFKKVASYLICPIFPRSERGNRYILTAVDFATRYPEAIALPSIETTRVAEALVENYSRLGVPREVLSDQGTQLISDLMKEVNRLLSVKQMATTPYHAMCNGLCEKYNGTLKIMIKRLCQEKPTDWDRYLCPLLFAYREVPHEGLGFSPFELLFGRTVRGPMSILKELWTGKVESNEVKSSCKFVLDLRDRIDETCKIAQEELAQSHMRYRALYNRKARNRKFEKGDSVLILLPTDSNKLLMQWKGPYEVVEVLSECNYRVNVKGNVKTYHANLLKRYIHRKDVQGRSSRSKIVGASVKAKPDNDDLLALWDFTHDKNHEKIVICPDLSAEHLSEIKKLIEELRDIFSDQPGETKLEQHRIRITSGEPVRSRPYPTSYAIREAIKIEVDKMIEIGIVEKSNSPYASPVVLVRKPDGSNRFCIDHRKLNRITVFDAGPMGRAEDIYVKIANEWYLSKLDLAKGYWQIPIDKDDTCIPLS